MDQIDGEHAKAVLSDEYLNKVDQLVAQHIMKWVAHETTFSFHTFLAWCRKLSTTGKPFPVLPVEDWKPTRNRDQAMMVFERCENMELDHAWNEDGHVYRAKIVDPVTRAVRHLHTADTPMLAACLASLKWAGVEVPE